MTANERRGAAAAVFLLALALLAIPALAQPAGGGNGLSVIGPAPPFTLASQDNKPVSLADLRGKVVAVTFIYTGCPDICPLLTQTSTFRTRWGASSVPRSPLFRFPSTRSATRRRC
jgi:cytochrome oxidase Cu insertion factor (SCO1/SenC/PrrC family)